MLSEKHAQSFVFCNVELCYRCRPHETDDNAAAAANVFVVNQIFAQHRQRRRACRRWRVYVIIVTRIIWQQLDAKTTPPTTTTQRQHRCRWRLVCVFGRQRHLARVCAGVFWSLDIFAKVSSASHSTSCGTALFSMLGVCVRVCAGSCFLHRVVDAI